MGWLKSLPYQLHPALASCHQSLELVVLSIQTVNDHLFDANKCIVYASQLSLQAQSVAVYKITTHVWLNWDYFSYASNRG
ncbi:hypothetical protein BT63DRAFT_429812 [Microthyrium microscopicum]|uniref:Uncharacterized protein n=1 Tax=Microthyrium microscopicum TaxID=703497 RepID=A0A6A6TY96_9PEZI|nr:hypothetical protein BT63DRAFT_429812 [Microthyrium microscopicum]